MRIFLPLLFMTGLVMACRAQETPSLSKAPQTDVVRVIKLNILSPGIGVEQPIGRQQTLYLLIRGSLIQVQQGELQNQAVTTISE